MPQANVLSETELSMYKYFLTDTKPSTWLDGVKTTYSSILFFTHEVNAKARS